MEGTDSDDAYGADDGDDASCGEVCEDEEPDELEGVNPEAVCGALPLGLGLPSEDAPEGEDVEGEDDVDEGADEGEAEGAGPRLGVHCVRGVQQLVCWCWRKEGEREGRDEDGERDDVRGGVSRPGRGL